MALHNLAYSYWAGYNSFVGKEAQEIEKNLKDVEKLDKNDEDFKNFEKKIMEAGKENKNVIPYFKRAIKSFECKSC